MACGQKPELILAPVENALAEQTAGSNGDLGLVHLIAFPLRISRRINERQNALPLMILQKVLYDVPRHGHYEQNQKNRRYNNPRPYSP